MRPGLFMIWCRFERDHINPLTGRRGQWRTLVSVECYRPDLPVRNYAGDMNMIGVISTKRYRNGSIIRPHKELNRVLVAMREPVEKPTTRSVITRPLPYYEISA